MSAGLQLMKGLSQNGGSASNLASLDGHRHGLPRIK